MKKLLPRFISCLSYKNEERKLSYGRPLVVYKISYLFLSSFRNLHILKTFISFYFPMLRMNVSL